MIQTTDHLSAKPLKTMSCLLEQIVLILGQEESLSSCLGVPKKILNHLATISIMMMTVKKKRRAPKPM